MRRIVKRLLDLRLPRGGSAFLWGPRRAGKTWWLRHEFVTERDWVIDLLKTDEYADYAARPSLLRERWDGRRVVIDEVQQVPALLDEVHGLIESRGASFLLTGSSARKLRRGHANLLAGRARRHEMGPLSFLEVEGFDLERAMQSGLLPPLYLSEEPETDLRAYVADYLKEEIAAEAAARNIPAFAEFLRAAALTNAELVNYTNIARETGVSAKVVKGYFEILEDTLLGSRLRAWTRSRKRRMIAADKFYFFDVGVANHLARRRPVLGSSDFGKSFEHYIWMELTSYRRYRDPDLELSYWRTSTGYEVDFILGEMRAAVEVKGSARVHEGDLRGLAALAEEAKARRRIVVCLEPMPRKLEGVEILPWKIFVERLHAGDLA
ncbi:MAG: ATP-binding protein [Planctomycetes bacterium]|nr:ATP-binding protein [Planctomycetota bacterium]